MYNASAISKQPINTLSSAIAPTKPASTSTTAQTILFIMVDQLSAKWLEVAESGVVDLPNLRKLRKISTVYNRAYSINPVCSPARATLLTGYRPEVHGLTECGYALNPEVPTLPRELQKHGWKTALAGKLHVRVQLETSYPDYKQYGFSETAVTEDSRVGNWLDWVKQTYPQHYEAALATVWMDFIEDLSCYGVEGCDLRSQIRAAAEKYPQCRTECYTLPFPPEVSQTAWVTQQTLKFLRETNSDKNIFLQASYVQPHNPFSPPAKYLEKVNTDKIPRPLTAEWQQENLPYFKQELYRLPSYKQRDWLRDRHHYFADLAHLDEEIGKLIRGLEACGRAENALIIFTSDHGEILHDHGILGKWERHYDACVRIPLYVKYPNNQSAVISQLVSHLDVVPTMYDYAGINQPMHSIWNRNGEKLLEPTLPGHSLKENSQTLISSEDSQKSDYRPILISSNNNHWQPKVSSWSRTVVTEKYRFTHFFADGGEQLFDLQIDPDEEHNLAYQKEYKELVEQIRNQLLELTVQANYPSTKVGLFQVGSW